MMVFLFNQHLKHLEMISNDIYTKAVQDVLEFIDTVEDGPFTPDKDLYECICKTNYIGFKYDW
jgi:hypothetical protein